MGTVFTVIGYRGDRDKSYGNTVGMRTIMQQTAVLKLRNYSVTVGLVLWYGVRLYSVCSTLQVFLVRDYFVC